MLPTDNLAPAFGSIHITQVTDVELQQFAELIYRRTGICIPPQKKLLLSNRLRRRLKSTDIADFGGYYRHLRRLHAEDPEWDALLQEVTTHETYLFRDERQWDWFRNVFLPERMILARQGKIIRTLRIWSAACSTGDEAMTIACCIAATLPDPLLWRIQIVGTDIGRGALQEAERATFGQRAMQHVPDEYRRRFFLPAKDGTTWRALPVLTEMISFRQHNLMEPLGERPFDLVVLKNVLIYFDAASKTTVLHHLRRALVSGGLLLAGAAEGVASMLSDFERIEPWLFRKPSL
jgi:chemotaxis protein methyltransferase CheR